MRRAFLGVFGSALALVIGLGPVTLSRGASGESDPSTSLALMRPRPAPARDFQIPTPDDGSLRLSDFKGKVVFLNFWATWCKPCEEEMPSMERLYQKFKGRGLVVLAVSSDSERPATVAAFVRKHKLSFPVGLDPRMTIGAQYGVWSLPATFIIDRKGQRVLAAQGPRAWDGPAADTLFDAMLKSEP